MTSARISPTAHYTGQVWCRNGLSPRELSTPAGVAMYQALRLPMRLAALGTGGLTLEDMLLERHRLIDGLLDEAIASGRVGQVVEVAAGLSGRGLRMTQRHPALTYVEADLPAMAARKRGMLAGVAAHRVIAVDALAEEGPLSIAAALGDVLDPARGTAILTEGLISYFSRDIVEGMWRRFAAALRRYPHGLYLSDIYLDQGPNRSALVRAFRVLLGVAVRGAIHLHHPSEEALKRALGAAGFGGECALVHPRRGYVSVVAASTSRSPR